jgi:hypothetical protein
METNVRTRRPLITIARSIAGWALCGAAVRTGMAATTLENAPINHGVTAVFGVP